MEYALRPASEADKAWLDQLRRQAYADLFVATWGGWDEERHIRHFAESWRQGHIRVVWVGDAPVGMIQVLESDDAVTIEEIQILPAYQSRGLGRALLNGVVDRARSQRKHTELAVALENVRAKALYLRLGFEEIDVSDTHFHMRLSMGV